MTEPIKLKLTEMVTVNRFDEAKLRSELIKIWGECGAHVELLDSMVAEIERLKKEIIWRKTETARADKNEAKVDITTDHLEKTKKRIDDLKTQLTEADKVIGLYKELDDERDWYKTYTKNIYIPRCGCTRKAYEVAGRIVPAGRCAAHGDIAKALADYDNSRGKGARREPESRVELINRIQGNVRVEIEESDATLTDAMETHSDLMNLGDALFNQPPDKCKTCDGKKRVPDGTESDLGFGTEYHPTPNYMDCPDCTGKKGGGDG